MITKEQLQAMSDFEVNKALAEMLGLKISENQYMDYDYRDGRVVIIDRYSVGDTTVDYCNTPNDIMPLAFEHGVGLAPNKDSWEAFTLEDNYQVVQNQFVDGFPLRAIACCLILVLQEIK